MRRARPVIALAWICLGVASARADIPTTDAAQLTQRSQTASATVKLVPITTQRQDANNGVKCAVTTGKKANVTDPTVKPAAGAGSQAIQPYAPEMPATPQAGATGATLSSQTLYKSSGDVVAGLDASRSTLTAAQSVFRTAGQQIGTATTVTAAFDMNSAARLQNSLAWNATIGSANLWVTALNALNLALNSDLSRAAIGMRSTLSPASGANRLACPVGLIGSGTIADPCRSAATCSTTQPGVPVDPACVASRILDADGSVSFFLGQVQSAIAASSLSDPATEPVTDADVRAALSALQASSR